MATSAKDNVLGISGAYHINGNHVGHGDYQAEAQQTGDRDTDIQFLLSAIDTARCKSNAFITNEMDKMKNKGSPPQKKQRLQ